MAEGYYALFWRPITAEESKIIKDYALTEIYETYGDTEENKEYGLYNPVRYEEFVKSYNENIPCINGKYYWWESHIGSRNPYISKEDNDEIVCWIQGYGHFLEISKYGRVLYIRNRFWTKWKVCKNRRQLRKYLGKQYFELSEEQLNKISTFFREYKGGIITLV